MSNQGGQAVLFHPLTGRAIAVESTQAADWRAMGWLDDKPAGGNQTEGAEPDQTEGAEPDQTEPASDSQTEGAEPDQTEGAEASPKTRGRAKK